ncbi:MAG TPA: M48 family metallopeptidase [Vicinamibacterales bacterium]|nr:M48 family metallopeptidase [Vicinamibacterales bacterium]
MNEDKASRYHRLRRRADLLGTVSAAAFLIFLLVSGSGLYLREIGSFIGEPIGNGFEEYATVVGLSIVLVVLLQLIDLPFAFYQGYRLEHHYGLSNQTLGQWIRDYLKGALLSLVLAAVAGSIVYAALRNAPNWWWAICAGIFAVALVGLVQLAPVLLLPLFYTFKPLDRPTLVERLMKLAARARTRVGGVYEWALSAHTKKANAALAGMGRTRRILLSDTLLADYSDDEIEVVLAHELSHHVHHDLWRGMALQTVLMFVSFLAAHLALRRWADPLELRGFEDPAGMPLLLLVGGVSSFLLAPLANAASRSHERRADRYALDTTQQPAAFISAMKRLSQQNLAEDHPSRLVQWLFYSHPPIRERIDAARGWSSSADYADHADRRLNR